MAYVPTLWATGDVITAEKLNKAEEGIEAASMKLVTIDATNKNEQNKIYLSDTDQEIVQAAWDNKIPSFYAKCVPLTGSGGPEYDIRAVVNVGFYTDSGGSIPMFELHSSNMIAGVNSVDSYIKKDESGWYGHYYSD